MTSLLYLNSSVLETQATILSINPVPDSDFIEITLDKTILHPQVHVLVYNNRVEDNHQTLE